MYDDLLNKYSELLSGLESTFIHYARLDPKLHDHDVLKIIEELIRCYRAKETNFPYEERSDRLHKEIYSVSKELVQKAEANHSSKEIHEALKRLKKSLEQWNRELGSRGYLRYIDQFLIEEKKEVFVSEKT